MAKLSSLAALVRELQAEGYDAREIARAVKLALEPSEAVLTRIGRSLQRAARRAAVSAGLGEQQLAAARRMLRQTERELAAEAEAGRKQQGLGTTLKKMAAPKKRRTKPLRQLSPAYRKRIRKGLAAGKSRREAGGHKGKQARRKAARRRIQLPPQAQDLQGRLEFRWDVFVYMDYNGRERERAPFSAILDTDDLAEARNRLAAGDEEGMARAIEAAALEKYLGRTVYSQGEFATVDQPENARPEIIPRG